MRNFLTFFLVLFINNILSQYPITDNFTSIGGANQWFKVTTTGYYAPTAMGVDGGNLCYNVSPATYATSSYYSFQSPNYGTQFVTNKCDSISTTFKVSVNIRNTDQFTFWYYNAGVWNGYIIPSSNTWTVNLPKTTQYFSFDLQTAGNGSRSGKYVHVDYFTIDCYKVVVLPIELISFKGTPEERCNKIEWITASEIYNDYFTLEKTYDGVNYSIVTIVNGAGYSTQLKTYYFEDYNPNDLTYYRLKQTDFDGKFVYSNIICIFRKDDIEKKTILKIVNSLGQEVNEDFVGVKYYYFTDGTCEKKY